MQTPAGATALVSYVKPIEGTAPSVAELTAHLAELVPNYMVPQAIMLLDRVPLTPVGKLDRKLLPEPVFGAAHDYRAPSTPAERALCAAFADVLGVEKVGVDDGFFELGGNSLLATKVVAQLRSAGIEMAVQLMFGDSTPAAIARRLDADAGEALIAALEPLLAIRKPAAGQAVTAPLFCVHPAIGLSWCYAGLLAQLPGDRPVYGLQAPHVTGANEHDSLVAAARDYVAQIRSVQPEGPYHLLGWSLGGLIAHEMAVQLQDAGERVALLAMMDSYRLSDEWLEHAIPGVAEIIGEFGSDLLGGDHGVDPRLTLQDAAELLRNRPGPFAALDGGTPAAPLRRLRQRRGARARLPAPGLRRRPDLLHRRRGRDQPGRPDPLRRGMGAVRDRCDPRPEGALPPFGHDNAGGAGRDRPGAAGPAGRGGRAPRSEGDAVTLAVEVAGLVKQYGRVRVLDGIDLEIPSGTVMGLLGPNGAGKTTTVRIVTTLLRPTAGTVRVAGHRRAARSGQGAQPHRVVRAVRGGRCESVGIREPADGRAAVRDVAATVRGPCAGAARRAGARACRGPARGHLFRRHGPAAGPGGRAGGAAGVVVLDEPTTGLDPRGRMDMWRVIGDLVDDGTTVLLTTQYLEEADLLADRITVIDRGRVIAARLGRRTEDLHRRRPADGHPGRRAGCRNRR